MYTHILSRELLFDTFNIFYKILIINIFTDYLFIYMYLFICVILTIHRVINRFLLSNNTAWFECLCSL